MAACFCPLQPTANLQSERNFKRSTYPRIYFKATTTIMAEAIGLAASALIIIYAASKITSLSYTYLWGVTRAQSSRHNLMIELRLLGQFIVALQEYVDAIPESPALQKLNSSVDDPLHECAQQFGRLRSSMEQHSGFRRVVDCLMWPVKEGEVMQELARFERIKEIFTLALNMDHELLLRGMESNVRQTWLSTQAIETCAKNTNVTVYETKKLLSM